MVVFRKPVEIHDNAKLKERYFATYKVYCVCDGCDWEYAGAVGYGRKEKKNNVYNRWDNHVNAIEKPTKAFGVHFATKHPTAVVANPSKQQRADLLRFELERDFAPTADELKNRDPLREKIRCREQTLNDAIPEERRINRRRPADKDLCPS